jgi:hypothetical protein
VINLQIQRVLTGVSYKKKVRIRKNIEPKRFETMTDIIQDLLIGQGRVFGSIDKDDY